MEKLMDYCRGSEDKIEKRLLTSIGTRHCILPDKYFLYVEKILECKNNYRELILYYYVIEIANAFYLKNNNLTYSRMRINDINDYFIGFSCEDIAMCIKFINEFFNDEYKDYFKELGHGDQK